MSDRATNLVYRRCATCAVEWLDGRDPRPCSCPPPAPAVARIEPEKQLLKVRPAATISRPGFPCPLCDAPLRVADCRNTVHGRFRSRHCANGHWFATQEKILQ